MITAVRMECWKSRRRCLWLVCAALLGVELLWIFWSFHNPSQQEREKGWSYLLYNMPLLNGILFPVIGSVLASRIADVEHKGNTLKLLETIQPKTQLLHAKLLLGAAYLLPIAVIQVFMLLGMGFFYHFYGQPALTDYFEYAFFTSSSCFAVFALQLVLSITIKNQVIPLCIGLAGSFAALLLMFLPSNLARLLFGPYGFFGALSFIYMSDWNPDTRVFTFIRTPTPWDNYAVLLAWVTATYVLGRILLKRKEL